LVAWAIAAVAPRVPWRADCLPQALAADRWLRRHGVVPDFYLGVIKPKHGALEAHAWLSCNGRPITGGTGAAFTSLLTPQAPVPAPATAADGRPAPLTAED
jgi:hypothetical protein